MAGSVPLPKWLMLCRFVVWATAALTAGVFFRAEYAAAWPVAAFGALFALLWPAALRASPPDGEADASSSPNSAAPSELSSRLLPRRIDLGMDLIVATALIYASGGVHSPFAPLLFFLVTEAYVLLGSMAALAVSLAAALLGMAALWANGVGAQAALLYGLEIGMPLVCALLIALKPKPVETGDDEISDDRPLFSLWAKRSPVHGKPPAVQLLEKHLEETDVAYHQLKKTYREVAYLHRDQKAQIERLRAGEQFFEISATVAMPDGNAAGAYSRLLHVVMELLEAGGGALWLRGRNEDVFTVRATEGRIGASLRAASVPDIAETAPSDLRARCESQLLVAAPASPAVPYAAGRAPEILAEETAVENALGDESEEETMISGSIAHPVVVVLLRERTEEPGTAGALLGAVGICDPRGAARFSNADRDRLESLSAPLSAALENVEQRRQSERSVREISLLYDLSRLVQSATDIQQVYKVVVAQAHHLVPSENCTLFLLDKTRAHLEAKATRGRVVNLLAHIAFEKGPGISGWVAGRGKPLTISDLSKAQNLLNIETLPPRIRSFAAIPLKVRDTIVGVLNVSDSRANAFSAEDIRLLTILAGQAAVTIERTEEFHTLETLAITDGLTGIYNHRYFQMRLDDEMRRARRYQLAVTLMILDVDGFKAINDRYGHTGGDVVLQELAALLRQSVRETEIVARYGGEEFALILPQTGPEQAQTAAERVLALVESAAFSSPEGFPIRLTVSIGLATFPLNGQTRAALIAQADQALYAAKNGGRNRVAAASGMLALPETHAVTQVVTPASASSSELSPSA